MKKVLTIVKEALEAEGYQGITIGDRNGNHYLKGSFDGLGFRVDGIRIVDDFGGAVIVDCPAEGFDNEEEHVEWILFNVDGESA
jgi:hypothetical protein